jgi:hypothetical protein
MLGFLYAWPRYYGLQDDDAIPPFISTTNFAARITDVEYWVDVIYYSVWDCRHGRVLLCDMDTEPMRFVVWDPMTGCRSEMLAPDYYVSQRAVVLCTVSGCDHRACKGGPFRVVLIGIKKEAYGYVAYTHVFMPEVGKWSEPCSTLRVCLVAWFY